MNEKDFLGNLQNIDKDNIPAQIMARVKKEFINNDNFKPNRVAQASFAAKGLCEWIIKLKEYDEINRAIQPKRLALKNAQASYQ
jgi:dynein heavy chain